MTLQPIHYILGFSLLILVGGIVLFIRDPRRLYSMAFVIMGTGLTLLSLVVLADANNWLGSAPQILVLLILLVPLLGYPVLTVFLLINGFLMIRRESRTAGNLLSLLAGLVLLLWPILPLLLSAAEVSGAVIGTITFTFGGLGFYFSGLFLVFLCAAVAYRLIPPRKAADYVVILGSGLIGAKVPPLLAARIDKGIALAGEHATIIPSGGQGADEDTAEGTAMAHYLQEAGIPASRILVEDKAATTEENLLLSYKLMDKPNPGIIVATSDYHVFRTALLTRALGIQATVRGAKTAFYFVPSAFIREFIAICREHLKFIAVFPVLWVLINLAFLFLGGW